MRLLKLVFAVHTLLYFHKFKQQFKTHTIKPDLIKIAFNLHYIVFLRRKKSRNYAIKEDFVFGHFDHTDLNAFIVLFYARFCLIEWNLMLLIMISNTYKSMRKPYKIKNT